ncbi:protein rigor mortis [Episyrphus balteatus]|uniref:protein rigor mortis n=1 Tax=Episyrphus balteatus TaxID=286459 RepID=UPI002486C32F|nr:protein rigor mortis [Episyrphus balteatus]
MATPVVKVPIVPQWNLVAGCVATPDQGFLYVGNKTINYISAIKSGEQAPVMKIFQTRQTIRGLDCDPSWATTKYFAILAQDNSVQIWDFDQARAIYGHKAHFIKPHNEGDIPGPANEGVHMGFMFNRNILSICPNDLVVYCVASNTFCRRQRIIPKKYPVTILKCSPFNENIFAVGTPKGLVILADLRTEQVLYTLKGHDASVTSLAWNIINAPCSVVVAAPTVDTPQKPPQQKSRPDPKTPIGGSDDIFDIYDYDYLENEFGAPCNNKQSLEQFEGIDKNQEDGNNTNFNYVEACESLKEEIDALKNKSDSFNEPQVTLEDCQESEHRAEVSSSCDSNNSVELLDKSSTDESTNKEKHVMQHQAEVHTQEEMELTPPRVAMAPPASPKKIPLLASAGADSVVWIWNTKTGGACDQLKGRSTPHGKNYHIEALWLSSNNLLITSRSGTITSFTEDITRPGKYKEDKKEFPQQAVMSMCLSIKAPLLWTISSFREIVCENLETNKIIAKYSCASTNIITMRERPDDMNKIAIAFSDRRIGVIDISQISPFNISIENFTSKIDSQVYSLVWGPNPGFLAFGTNEGRVGIFNTDNPKMAPFLYHPVSGKPIYSIDWKNHYIYVCCNEKVALYHDNMQNKDPIVLEYITAASSISVRGKYLFVGTQNGHVEIFREKESPKISYDLIRSLEICPRYVTDISWSPINSSRFAVASMSKKIRVFNFNEFDGTASLARDIVINSTSASNANVKWSNSRDNMLLASGFDGAMRVWDLNSQRDDEFFLKQFQCPMTCGMFLPSDENIVMCAGRTTSIEMFNMLLENTQKYSSVKWKKQTMKTLDGVQWGTRIPSGDGKSKKEKSRKRKEKIGGPLIEAAPEDVKTDGEDVAGLMTKLQLEEKQENEISGPTQCKECKDSVFLKNPPTILYLTTKEINKDSLDKLIFMLDSSHGKQRLLGPKLFGTKTDAKRVLEEEIRNQQSSNSTSISSILTYQVNTNLQQEIVKRIETKTLTEWHVSLAPSVSYMFWKKCCQAFTNQLIEQGHILQAATYLIALHDTKQVINILMDKQFFKEAIVIAKIHCQPDDKITTEITDKWVRYLESVGNLNAAAYICAASGQLQRAYNVLCKTRNITPEIQEVLDKIHERTIKM